MSFSMNCSADIVGHLGTFCLLVYVNTVNLDMLLFSYTVFQLLYNRGVWIFRYRQCVTTDPTILLLYYSSVKAYGHSLNFLHDHFEFNGVFKSSWEVYI